jgi:uncharacterized protein (TIGR02117 family)
VRLLLRAAGVALAALLILVAAYAVTALALGAWPRNADFVESPDGIPVYVRTNGVHADIVVPTRSAEIDWSAEFPARHMRALAAPTEWIAFGWGDRGFMLTTPTWADLRPATALVAISGLGEGVMHVEYIESPMAYNARRVRVSTAQYQQLVAAIRASFNRGPDGELRKVDAPGYFDGDAFYEAVPRYTFWYTCNEWTRRVLAVSGVRTPAWSPFDTAIMAHLPQPARR